MSSDDVRAHLLACLGGDWPAPPALNAQRSDPQARDGYTIERLSYDAEPGDPIPAYLLVPDGVSATSPAPAVAIWHQHNGDYPTGKSEPAGEAGAPMHHTGVALARAGYIVLCPDALCFEDRQDPTGTLAGGLYERFEFLRYVVAGKSLAWKNILDMRRAIDFLVSLPSVRADRIGCYGHSMGATHTWLVGPWEPRLRALAANCCLPTMAAIERTHLLHCFPNFIPGLTRHGHDTPDIAALIAPRPLLINLGERDGGSPMPEAHHALDHIAAAYAAAGAPDHFDPYIEPATGHVLSPTMYARTLAFLHRHLRDT